MSKVTPNGGSEIQNGGVCFFCKLLISALTVEVTSQMQTHSWHPRPPGQKNGPQILERWSSNKATGRNLQERSNFKAYVPGNPNLFLNTENLQKIYTDLPNKVNPEIK